MKKLLLSTCLLLTLGTAGAQVAVGQPAPAFTATDTSGKAVSLASFKGRHVVLEWVNPGCPYVQRHYNGAHMQAKQKDAAAQGVVWLAINSTAADHGDYLKPAALGQWMQTHKAAPTATLLDTDGHIGRAYGARTTPHLFIVNPAGTLVYAGAVDDKPSGDAASATPHVKLALAESLAGKPVSMPATRPYGCSVKYSAG